ncbi:MAG: hypothetical protein M3332_18000 [Actinomycetota bacterium]|nr:hypothetical protein [Actinomycetota bacterium]
MAIDWIMHSVGDTKWSRRVWAFAFYLFAVWSAGPLIGWIWSLVGGEPVRSSLFQIFLSGVFAVFFGGLTVGLINQSSVYGRLWIISSPLFALVVLVSGFATITSAYSNEFLPGANISGLVNILIGLIIFVQWSSFLASAMESYRIATKLVFIGELGLALVVLGAVVLFVFSGGERSGLLVVLALILGITVIARGAGRIRKLFRALQV